MDAIGVLLETQTLFTSVIAAGYQAFFSEGRPLSNEIKAG